MATPSYSYVMSQINTFIVANGNNEITANVLNPILELITDFANNHMGNLDNLTTDETDTLVDAINSLKQNINDIVGNSVQLHTGNGNPNDTPPSTYNYGDFYMQLSPLDNDPIQLWQFNGFEWFAPDAATSWGDIEGNIADQTDLQGALDLKADVTDLEDYQLLSEKGEANGYTPLDSGAKIPIEFLPDSVIGQVNYQGTWNASTNTPDVGDATTQKGYYYVTSVGGTYSGISYEVGDWIISNGVEWQKVDNTDAVVSVFGRIGAVVANSSDYAAFYVDLSSYTASDVLSKLLTVDGTGSGLDADLLRGVHWGNVNTAIISNSDITGRDFFSSRDGVGIVEIVGVSTGCVVGTDTNHDLILRRNNVERARLTSVGLSVNGTLIGNSSASFTGTATAAPATLSTELVTKGQLDAAVRPYKVYTALITQSGTNDPTAIVLENTLGGTVVWSRSSQGVYLGTLSGAFTSNKTVVFVSGGSTSNMSEFRGGYYNSTNDVVIKTALLTGTLSDNLLVISSVEIRVYP